MNHILVTVVFDCDEDLWSMLKILARFNTFQVLASGDGVGDEPVWLTEMSNRFTWRSPFASVRAT